MGDMENRGLEFNFTWKDRKGDLRYQANFNFAKNWTQLKSWSEFQNKGWEYVGMPWRFVYLYEQNGVAQTWQDVYSNTPQGISPGDIIRIDVNGDGRIDANDKVAYPEVQRNRPTTTFALSGSASWKGFDVAVMFQGATGRKDFWLTNYNNVNPGSLRYAFGYEHWTNPWSVENRDGEWPRLGGSSNREESTFWLDDLSYVRLKNVQLGYNLPKKWLRHVGVSSFRIYFSGENLATLTNYRGLDPERAGRGNSGGNASDVYPLTKSYSLGLNLSF